MYNTVRLLNTLAEQYVLLAIYLEFIFFFLSEPRRYACVNQGYNYSFSSFQLWNESMVSYISEQSSKTLAAADSLVWDPDRSSYQSIS